LVGCHKNQGQNPTEKPDKNEENSSCYERRKIIGSTELKLYQLFS